MTIKNFLENLNIDSGEPKSDLFLKRDDNKINKHDPNEIKAVNEIIFLYHLGQLEVHLPAH